MQERRRQRVTVFAEKEGVSGRPIGVWVAPESVEGYLCVSALGAVMCHCAD